MVIRDASGTVVAKAAKGRGGSLTILLPKGATQDGAALHAILDEVLAKLAG